SFGGSPASATLDGEAAVPLERNEIGGGTYRRRPACLVATCSKKGRAGFEARVRLREDGLPAVAFGEGWSQ
ncbi:MAG: hypothetical protein WCG03_09555, partial [Kiritimatiellales bacterium]